jgi:ribosomal protein S18 acetylase RimI-like enzyme
MNQLSPSPSLVPPSSSYWLGGRNPSGCGPVAWAGEAYEPGDFVVTRCLSESDWDMIRAFVQNIERNDLRLRFGLAIDFHDEASLRRYFGINPKSGEIGWLLDEHCSIAGISHRVVISKFEAEIALIVRSDLKRRGIGRRMLDCLIRRSTDERLRTVSAFVLHENRPMLELARKAGFVVRRSLGLNVELALALGRTDRGTFASGASRARGARPSQRPAASEPEPCPL